MMDLELSVRSSRPLLRQAATLTTLLTDLQSESMYSSNLDELSAFILAELGAYLNALNHEGVEHTTAYKASYILCSAFDDVFTAKRLFSGNLRGFLLQQHNVPGALSQLFEYCDECSRNLSPGNADLAILLYLILELGYQGKHLGHPDAEAIVSVHKQKLLSALGQQMHRRPAATAAATAATQAPSRARAPLWTLASLALMIGAATYTATNLFFEKKFVAVEAAITHFIEHADRK